jgi:hypothetical protein
MDFLKFRIRELDVTGRDRSSCKHDNVPLTRSSIKKLSLDEQFLSRELVLFIFIYLLLFYNPLKILKESN